MRSADSCISIFFNTLPTFYSACCHVERLLQQKSETRFALKTVLMLLIFCKADVQCWKFLAGDKQFFKRMLVRWVSFFKRWSDMKDYRRLLCSGAEKQTKVWCYALSFEVQVTLFTTKLNSAPVNDQ